VTIRTSFVIENFSEFQESWELEIVKYKFETLGYITAEWLVLSGSNTGHRDFPHFLHADVVRFP
jgi:hypothetical protein